MQGESDNCCKAVVNELGRLSNSIDNRVRLTNTIEFIVKEEVPKGCTVTYANFVCDYHPLKSEPFRVRLTVGGDRLEYPDYDSSPTASLLEPKLLLNSTISDSRRGAIFMSYDMKDCFLETPMSRADYMRIHSKYLPPNIRALYHIDELIGEDGYVYIKIIKVIYGLKQAAIIAYNQLISHMEPHGYYPVPFTTVIWAPKTSRTKFCLCVDNCVVKYFNKYDAYHILESVKNHYAFSNYWEGFNYLVLKMYWNYRKEYVDILIPEYVKKRWIYFNILTQKDLHMHHISGRFLVV